MFPNREESGQKATLFSFCIKCRKIFPTLLLGNVVENIPTLQVLDLYKSKRFIPFFHCASCSGLEVAPCYLLFHLLSSCCPVPQQFLFQGGALLGIWTEGHSRGGKWRQSGFLIYVLKLTEVLQSPWKRPSPMLLSLSFHHSLSVKS